MDVYANVWTRFVAYIIDFIIALILAIVIGWALLSINDSLAVIVAILVYFGYYSLLESSSIQATIGKRLLKIKVVDKNGSHLSPLRSTARNFCKILLTITPVSLLTLLNGLIIDYSAYRTALYDIIAGTRVVKADYTGGPILPVVKKEKTTGQVVKTILLIILAIVGMIVLAAVIAAFIFGMAGSV